jgi:hypothetical protein
MAEAVILEFTGVGEAQYNSVNEKLGIDPKAGTGDWPAGLHTHLAGSSDDGTFVVAEVWSSRQAQADFMDSRLGEALAAGGVPAPSKVTWVSLITHHTPGA